MKILCKNCSNEFEYKGNLAGEIEYVKCQNVFKIIYNAKILCPHCMIIVKPQIEGKKTVGIPLQDIIRNSEKDDLSTTSENEDNTKTRRALPTEAYEDVNGNLKPKGGNTKKLRIEAETQKLKASEKNQGKLLENKSINITIKSLRPKKGSPGWHLKINKKHGRFLKRLGFFVLFLICIPSIVQVLSDLMTNKSSYATNPKVLTPSSLITDPTVQTSAVANEKSDNNLDNNQKDPWTHDISLNELNKLLERKTLGPIKSKTTEEEPLESKEQTGIRFKKLLASLNVSSDFGYREDPWTHEIAYHTGIDIPRQYRSPIRAVMKGEVIFSGYKHGYGNLVIINHKGGVKTYYGHNAKNTVLEGDIIEEGTIIGYVGMTGRTTGPHLHFEVRKHDVPSNPINFLKKLIKKSDKVTI